MPFGSSLVIKFGGHELIDKKGLCMIAQCAVIEKGFVFVPSAL